MGQVRRVATTAIHRLGGAGQKRGRADHVPYPARFAGRQLGFHLLETCYVIEIGFVFERASNAVGFAFVDAACRARWIGVEAVRQRCLRSRSGVRSRWTSFGAIVRVGYALPTINSRCRCRLLRDRRQFEFDGVAVAKVFGTAQVRHLRHASS